MKQYQLVTVACGTAPASFLAARCLNKLENEEASSYPLAAEVITRDMYVDDFVTGSDISDARKLQEEIIYILKKEFSHYTNGVLTMQISWRVYQNICGSLNFLVF